MHPSLKEDGNWIPSSFQEAAKNLASELVRKYVRNDMVIGLGSGPMAAAIVREMGTFGSKESIECIPTSFQIKREAERSGLKLVDESMISKIDMVFDGADEIDRKFNMIKGGGGALLREKIVHSAAKKVVIAAESTKFVSSFGWPVPIEIHPFAIHIVEKKLEAAGGRPKMRTLKEGYPYVTENGNFILDTSFDFPSDARELEVGLKSIAGVIEVGIFTRQADVYYKAQEGGSFVAVQL